MKPILCSLTVAALFCAVSNVRGEIPWMNDLDSAKLAASKQNKLVLIHFYGDNCAPCKLLERNVFPQPEVASAINASYVPVMINASRRRDIATTYGVNRWPMDVIITPSGQVVSSGVSPQDPAKYVAVVQQAVHTAGLSSAPAAQPVQYTQPAGAGYGAQTANYPPQSNSYQPQNGAYGANTPPANAGGYQPRGSFQPQQQPAQPSQGQFNPQATAQTNPQGAAGPGAPAGGPNTYQYDPRGAEMAARRQAPWPPQGGAQPTQGNFQPTQPSYAPGQPAYGQQYGQAPPQQQVQRQPTGAPQGQQQFNGGPVGTPNPHAQRPTGPAVADSRGAAAPVAGGPPPGQSPLCLEGFCPVTLVESMKWVKSDERWGAIHRRRTYQFASEAAQQRFLADPDKYSPVLSGYDPVIFLEGRKLVPGERKHGVFFKKHIFLFSSEESLSRFWDAPQGYSAAAQQAMQQNALGPIMR